MKRREGTRSIGPGARKESTRKEFKGYGGKEKMRRQGRGRRREEGGNKVHQEKKRQEGMKKRDVGRWTEKERNRERER